MSQVQHCPSCDEEYVASATACVECGGPLTPGPLTRLEQGRRRNRSAPAAALPPADPDGQLAPSIDRLLAQLPGQEADLLVRSLLLEGIPCATECQGITKAHWPGEPPGLPLALTLPVNVYVEAAQLDAAREILSTSDRDDVIGEQWADAASDETVEASAITDAEAESAATAGAAGGNAALEPDGRKLRTVALVLAVALLLLFLFGR